MTELARTLRIGARSSPMSRAQVVRVQEAFRRYYPGVLTEFVPFTPSGDRDIARTELGQKGVYTAEIEAALLSGGIDIAVHCMKDVAGVPLAAPGTAFAAYLRRGDVRDSLVHPAGQSLDQLPTGTRIGTSAVRRAAQLRVARPDLEAVPIRGTANQRLDMLDAGEVDALILASSGLERIGQQQRITQLLGGDLMMPPLGAAVLGLQTRADDEALFYRLAPLSDPDTEAETVAERTALHDLEGHCNSPIAGRAVKHFDGSLVLTVLVFSADGSRVLRHSAEGDADDAALLGHETAAALIHLGAQQLIAETAP
ncbi:hydroxymethylbilane synthase [Streptacidiphilus cavernicola]|uniref:Hydroxymethylbilane synthase n=1 Tax=Streptacidiphilus cavernicola TaxID=3342716 RepID=A0ABV6VPB7_9ACTN